MCARFCHADDFGDVAFVFHAEGAVGIAESGFLEGISESLTGYLRPKIHQFVFKNIEAAGLVLAIVLVQFAGEAFDVLNFFTHHPQVVSEVSHRDLVFNMRVLLMELSGEPAAVTLRQLIHNEVAGFTCLP